MSRDEEFTITKNTVKIMWGLAVVIIAIVTQTVIFTVFATELRSDVDHIQKDFDKHQVHHYKGLAHDHN